MVYSLTWLPEVLEAAGLKVAETNGWRTRGRADMGVVRGVMCHHTATPSKAVGNMPTLNMLIKGRPDLAGPLCQLALGRDGTWYIVAAGRANHAGKGRWEGQENGNSNFIGIEAENDGLDPKNWPEVQLDSYERGVAAILKKIGANSNMCCGHKEYATPPGRKTDPSFEMAPFRAAVADLLAGKTPPPPIAAADEGARPTVRRGDKNDWVKKVQKAVGASPIDGDFGAGTEAKVRQFQRDHGLTPDGIVGPKSWIAMDGPPPAAPAAPAAPAVPKTVAPPAAPAAPASAAVPGLPVADDETHKVTVSATGRAVAPNGQVFAYPHKKGFQTLGVTSLKTWIDSLASPPAGATQSIVNIARAVSANEGRLEAINSWDDAFMSFGILQWTAGVASGEGELGRFLTDLKAADAAAFKECFGRYGLDARPVSASSAYGWLSLDGKELKTPDDKKVLRTATWAYRFWRAGHHPAVRAAQFASTVGRIKGFKDKLAAGRPLSAWLTSELGMALALDEHTNRPGHVPGTLATAIGKKFGANPPDPTNWTDAEELALIDAYIVARNQTNMTDRVNRAARLRNAVLTGELSDDRGSFKG